MPLAWGETIRRAAPGGEEDTHMRVTMTKTRQACPDGVTLTLLEAGETYDLNQGLAERYLERGFCKPANGSGKPQRSTEPPPAPAGNSASGGDGDVVNPIEGLNAKDAAAAIAEFTAEQLDAIPDDEERKTVLAAIADRREDLEHAGSDPDA